MNNFLMGLKHNPLSQLIRQKAEPHMTALSHRDFSYLCTHMVILLWARACHPMCLMLALLFKRYIISDTS